MFTQIKSHLEKIDLFYFTSDRRAKRTKDPTIVWYKHFFFLKYFQDSTFPNVLGIVLMSLFHCSQYDL